MADFVFKWDEEMHGIVLVQGLVEEKLPGTLNKLITRKYKHFLGGTHGTVDIVLLEVERAIAPNVAFHLSGALRPTRYYARINDSEEMYVAFPSCVAFIKRSESASAKAAREIGALYEISLAHMRFEEMFELDHPEMHDIQSGGVLT